MRANIPVQILAGFGLLLSLTLSGCTDQETVAPATPGCSELVTVHLCPSYGDVANCAALHTTLELANSYPGSPAGYYALPIGPVWQAYQAHQVDGQVLRVGFELGPPLPPNADGLRTATITCLEVADQVPLGK